jgi:hypothetical protein
MSHDGALNRKERMDELASQIRLCGEGGVSFSAAVIWSAREQGVLESKAREFIRILVRSGEIRHDAKSDRLYYIQPRGKQKNLATP